MITLYAAGVVYAALLIKRGRPGFGFLTLAALAVSAAFSFGK